MPIAANSLAFILTLLSASFITLYVLFIILNLLTFNGEHYIRPYCITGRWEDMTYPWTEEDYEQFSSKSVYK